MLNRATLRVNFILSLIGMLNRVTLRINLILSLIGMLNLVTLRIKLVFLEIFKNCLVGDELPPDDSFLFRPFRVLVEEPFAKYSVK